KVLQYLLGYHYTQYLLYQFVVHLAFFLSLTNWYRFLVFHHITFQFTLFFLDVDDYFFWGGGIPFAVPHATGEVLHDKIVCGVAAGILHI
ncbi:MAG: hypothetical protein IJ785_08740, partial [Bacteroidales bacterium]|nr:hypothetical protein [Bacteroidales bacterium]